MGARSWLSGGHRKIDAPNFFNPDQVGGMWGDYLKDLYRTPTDESPQFKRQSMALRDALTMESDTQKDEFGLATNAGGFYDSGARLSGLGDINRNRMASYTQGLAAILAKLESDKMGAAFPFLQAQTGLFSALESAKQGTEDAQTRRKIQLGQSMSAAGGQLGSMSSGSNTGSVQQ